MSGIHEKCCWILDHHPPPPRLLLPTRVWMWCADWKELKAWTQIQGKEEEQGGCWLAEEQ